MGPGRDDKAGKLAYLSEAMKRAKPYDREAALDAAMRLFWAKGYHATSLKDLEAALKMKPGSIYAAFTSKEALFLAALGRYFDTNRRRLRASLDAAPTPLAGLTGYLGDLGARDQAEMPCYACMLVKTLLDATPDDTLIAEQARAYLDLIRADFAAMFERAKAIGEIPADADCDRLARRFQSDIMALRIEVHRGTDQAALAALVDDMSASYGSGPFLDSGRPGAVSALP